MLEAVINAFAIPDLRRKILFTLAMLVIFRFIASIPVPGVDRAGLADFIDNNQLLGMLNLFSGSGLKTLLDRRPRRLSVHHRLDHHAVDDADHSPLERALEGGPAGTQQDQPVHALADRPAGAASGLRPALLFSRSNVGGGKPLLSELRTLQPATRSCPPLPSCRR